MSCSIYADDTNSVSGFNGQPNKYTVSIVLQVIPSVIYCYILVNKHHVFHTVTKPLSLQWNFPIN